TVAPRIQQPPPDQIGIACLRKLLECFEGRRHLQCHVLLPPARKGRSPGQRLVNPNSCTRTEQEQTGGVACPRAAYRSASRGISSTKLQGLWRLSSCALRI